MLSGISNPRPGLTPGTVLRAVGSGIMDGRVLLATLVLQNECKAQSNCVHDPTFRHPSLVFTPEEDTRLECRNVGS